MIVIEHKAKVVGHIAVLAEQINRMVMANMQYSQIAYILGISEGLAKEIYLNNAIEIVTESQGWELQAQKINVNFFTDVTFTVKDKEDYYFYKLIYDAEKIDDFITNYVASTYYVNAQKVLNNIFDALVDVMDKY